MKYRMRPIEVEAVQWTGDTAALSEFVGTMNWARADARDVAWPHDDDGEQVVVWSEAAKDWMPAPVGWWIVRGPLGDYYPCRPDVFEATFEPIEGPS